MLLSQIFEMKASAIANLKTKDINTLYKAVKVRALDSAEVRGLAKTILKKNIR